MKKKKKREEIVTKKRGRPRKDGEPVKEHEKGTQLGRKIRHRMFREEYMANSFNATRAYMKTFKVDADVARQRGQDLLKDPKMMSAIDQRITKLFDKLDIQNKDILIEQSKLAFIDIRSFFDENGSFVGLNKLNMAQQSCIESVEVEGIYQTVEIDGQKEEVLVGQKQKIKFYSRQKALDSLAKFVGLIKPENRVNNFFVNNSENKVEVITAAKELKEKLGASRITKLNKLLKTG